MAALKYQICMHSEIAQRFAMAKVTSGAIIHVLVAVTNYGKKTKMKPQRHKLVSCCGFASTNVFQQLKTNSPVVT